MQLSNFFAGSSYQYQIWFIYSLDNQNSVVLIFVPMYMCLNEL